MYKNFFVSLFSLACFSINSLSVNAGEKYFFSDNPYSYSQYNFNNLGSYILVNTIYNKNTQKTISNFNQALETLSVEANIENNFDNNLIITPQKKELWFKTYSEGTVINMLTDKCVSLLDVYKIVFNNKINTNNLNDDDAVSNSKNQLVKILLQLQHNNTQIFIPDLVFNINKVNKTSEILPLAYIDDILSSYNDTDAVIIYFHIDQLAKHSENLVTDTYNTEDETSKTSTQNISNRNIIVYRINLQTMEYTLLLHTTDGKKARIHDTIHDAYIL